MVLVWSGKAGYFDTVPKIDLIMKLAGGRLSSIITKCRVITKFDSKKISIEISKDYSEKRVLLPREV